MTLDQQDGNTSTDDSQSLEALIVATLESIYDPEIPVSIYALGLIYDIAIDNDAKVLITMTLTTPGCPVAEILPMEIEEKVCAIPDVKSARVEITWEPPWGPEMMSEAARLEIGMF